VAKGAFNKTVVEFVEKNRAALIKKYNSFDAYQTNFEADEQLLNTLVENGTKAGVALNAAEFEISKPLMRLQLKALIARDVFTNADYFKVMNTDDATVQKAIEVLSDYKAAWTKLEKNMKR
jgi:carboxyl-terminal processing protease